MVRRSTSSAPASKSIRQAPEQGDTPGEDVTRCICGNDEFISTPRTKALNASPGLYVQCETCNVWQHGFCMGFMAEKDVPNDYYCELCRPNFHRIVHRHGILVSKYTPASPSPEDSPADQSSSSETGGPEVKGTIKGPVEPQKLEYKDEEGGSNAGSRGTANLEVSNGHAQQLEEHESPAADQVKSENGGSLEHANEASSPSSAKQPSHSPGEDAKKRQKRGSESDANGGPRNRKQRRSREDEILQRVLEESAREAREAEARRLSVENGEDDEKAGLDEEANGRNNIENDADAEEFEANQDPEPEPELSSRPSRSRRARASAAAAAAVDTKKTEASKPGSTGRASSRGGANSGATRGSRGGSGGSGGPGRRGAKNGGNPSESAHTTSSSRRTANGVKKCKPRIPSPKTTFDEMRKRVSAILEFASRTQDEIHAEQTHGIEALQQAVTANKFDTPFKHLSKMCDRNSAYLEDLTRRLLKWEEHYGVNKSP